MSAKKKKYPPEEEAAFHEKQAAFEQLQQARANLTQAIADSDALRLERIAAEDKLNMAFAIMMEVRAQQAEIWRRFEQFRDQQIARINAIRQELALRRIEIADLEQRRNQKSTKNNRAFRTSLRKRQDDARALENQLTKLCDELRGRQHQAEIECDLPEIQAYRAAKEAFRLAKAKHEAASDMTKKFAAAVKSARTNFNKKESAYNALRAKRSIS